MMLKSDWYQGTLTGEKDPGPLAAQLLIGVGGDAVLREKGGLFGRPFSVRGEFLGGTVGLFYGADLDVVFRGSSGAAEHVMSVVREMYPEHTVSRVDVAVDFDESGVFIRLAELLRDLARSQKPRPVGTGVLGDWLDGRAGRTVTAGSRSSEVYLRLYEKGKELAVKHPEETFSDDLTRVEWEVKPQSRDKQRAATATMEQLAAWTPFGATVLAHITGLQLEAQQSLRAASTDPEYWLARQYGPVLRKWLSLDDPALRSHMATLLDRAVSSPRTSTAFAGPEDLRSGDFLGDRA